MFQATEETTQKHSRHRSPCSAASFAALPNCPAIFWTFTLFTQRFLVEILCNKLLHLLLEVRAGFHCFENDVRAKHRQVCNRHVRRVRPDGRTGHRHHGKHNCFRQKSTLPRFPRLSCPFAPHRAVANTAFRLHRRSWGISSAHPQSSPDEEATAKARVDPAIAAQELRNQRFAPFESKARIFHRRVGAGRRTAGRRGGAG